MELGASVEGEEVSIEEDNGAVSEELEISDEEDISSSVVVGEELSSPQATANRPNVAAAENAIKGVSLDFIGILPKKLFVHKLSKKYYTVT